MCEMTGMGAAVVARVTEKTWTACAVKDEAHFGLKPGMELAVNTTCCFDLRASRVPIVIEHVSADPRYCNLEAPKCYQIESYVSAPIIRAKGGYFGNRSALDPSLEKVAEPRILSMFTEFAALIVS
jgi:hypothetical protein